MRLQSLHQSSFAKVLILVFVVSSSLLLFGEGTEKFGPVSKSAPAKNDFFSDDDRGFESRRQHLEHICNIYQVTESLFSESSIGHLLRCSVIAHSYNKILYVLIPMCHILRMCDIFKLLFHFNPLKPKIF